MNTTDLPLAVLTPRGVSEPDTRLAIDHRCEETCAAIADHKRSLQPKNEAEMREPALACGVLPRTHRLGRRGPKPPLRSMPTEPILVPKRSLAAMLETSLIALIVLYPFVALFSRLLPAW